MVRDDSNETTISVLIVEDSSTDLDIARRLLERSQTVRFRCVEARSLATAQEVISRQSHAFDVILLDLTLPDISGLETLTAIRKLTPSTPVVISSGHDDEETALEAVKAGAHDYLFKDYQNAQLLVRTLRHAIERKRLEEKLVQTEQRLQFALNSPGIGIWTWKIGPDSIVFDGSHHPHLPGDLQVSAPLPPFGITDLLTQIDDTDRERVEAEIARTVRTGTLFDIDYALKPIDGQQRIVHARGELRKESDDESPELVCVCWDVTTTRNVQEENQKIQMKLQQTQKLESLGLLASGIAHDFNNLMRGISAHARIAEMETSAGSDGQEAAGQIVETTQQAMDLCSQLLAYAGQSRIVAKSCDFSEIVPSVLRMIEASVPPWMNISVDVDPNTPLLNADLNQMRQLILNLLTNAVDAVCEVRNTDEEGIEGRPDIQIKVWSEESRHSGSASILHVRESSGPGVILEFSDTGPGIEETVRNQIFDPFFTTKGTGRGLGLASVVGIAKAHGAGLHVENQTGGGLKIRLEFPVTGPVNQAVSRPDMMARRA